MGQSTSKSKMRAPFEGPTEGSGTGSLSRSTNSSLCLAKVKEVQGNKSPSIATASIGQGNCQDVIPKLMELPYAVPNDASAIERSMSQLAVKASPADLNTKQYYSIATANAEANLKTMGNGIQAAPVLPDFKANKLIFEYDHYGKLISGNHLGSAFKVVTPILAIDCEMVGVGELCDSVLARVSIVNTHGFCLYDKFVKPKLPVTDYRTMKSGVRECDLLNASPHESVIGEVAAILRGRIVVGHSVHNDFDALELAHPAQNTRDTAIYYKTLLKKQKTPSLQELTKQFLLLKIQQGEHSSILDAQVTMMLYLRESSKWEATLSEQCLPEIAHQAEPMRLMTVFPRNRDLTGTNGFVRPIQTHTPYTSQEVYLDTMFRLLREDFMRPLREGIRQFQRWRMSRNKKLIPTCVRVYEDVRICRGDGGPISELKGFRTIKIPLKQLSCDLSSTSEDSRYLINGSLLLFLPNSHGIGNFQAKMGTVVRCNDQDDDRLKKGELKVFLVPDGPSWTIDANTKFTVLESVAFFEAYRYALGSLQSMNMNKWPLQKYILNPTVPFKTITDVNLIDFSELIDTTDFGPRHGWQHAGFPSAKQLGLSHGQYHAYHSAITKELAIIQGPPGTGKTFLAMKIIKCFLHNPQLLNGGPILVVSNTNHSLDNLLEMVVLYLRKIMGKEEGDYAALRLGGRSKSKIVAEVSLHQKVENWNRKLRLKDMIKRAQLKVKTVKNLMSIDLRSEQDFEEVTRRLTLVQNYLKRPVSGPPCESVLDKEEKLELNVRSAIELLMSAMKSGDLKVAIEASLQLLHKPVLSLLVKSLQTKVDNLVWESEKLKHCKSGPASLASAQVIGVTVCGTTKHREKALDKVKPSMVIVEEAAHVVEATVVAGLTQFCRRLILIGDHKQLRPSTADHDLTVTTHFDVSIMQRFVQNAERKGLKTWSQLDVQRRMRPEISKLIHPSIYEVLYDDPIVKGYPNVKGMDKNLFFVDHAAYDAQAEGSTSYVNVLEAEFLVNLLHYLVAQGNKAEKITVIVTYLGQKFEIEKRLWQTRYHDKIRVCCVDGFQGEENDIILLSLVRSNDERNIGFLRTNNRVCVALSRARHGMYIVGNMTGLAARSNTWAEINETLKAGNHIGPKLKLKCEFHGYVTSIGIDGSHKPLHIMQYGNTRKCLCEIKADQEKIKPKPIVSNKASNQQLQSFTVPPPKKSESHWINLAPKLNQVECKNQNVAPNLSKAQCKTLQNVTPNLNKTESKHLQNIARKLNKAALPVPLPLMAVKEICKKKFACGHLCDQSCSKNGRGHINYQCQAMCNRVCNGGHKCEREHVCYLPCSKLITCKVQVSAACSACKKPIRGACSVLLPYFGKQSKSYGAKVKTKCTACK